jgi:hypothetical protein
MAQNLWHSSLVLVIPTLVASVSCMPSNITRSMPEPAAARAQRPTVELVESIEEHPSFSDDFSDPSSGWDRTHDEDGGTDYFDGKYRITISSSHIMWWANPGLEFGDVRIEVDAKLVDGGVDNSFGIICRYVDSNNFYALLISSDGYYAIRKRINGGELDVISGDGENYEFSDEIPQGDADLHLTALCVGDLLRLYVNNRLIAEAHDGDLATGDTGLIATSFDVDYTAIDFDDFIVIEQ